MSISDVHKKPGHLIRRAQQISTAIFQEECGRYDLTSVQYAALVGICENPGIDATRLSALIAFDRSTLGNVLERLEKKGLIVRDGTENDKRIKVVKLSPAGRALLNKVRPAVERVQERLLEPLRPADRAVLMRLLDELVQLNNDSSRAPLRIPD